MPLWYSCKVPKP